MIMLFFDKTRCYATTVTYNQKFTKTTVYSNSLYNLYYVGLDKNIFLGIASVWHNE